jgi:hypothetical protein
MSNLQQGGKCFNFHYYCPLFPQFLLYHLTFCF